MTSYTKKKVKYALLSYTTENIGDEIQSIAARRFLPTTDYHVDRDNIKALQPKANETVKVVMNGWYTHKPENWPPKDPNINPLLISMHISKKNRKVKRIFLSKQSREFLKKFGPVGARDTATLRLLEKNGIASYFSGCLTLTLQRDETLPRQDFILAVDVSPKLLKSIKQRTRRPVIPISTYYDPETPTDVRFIMAEYFLYLYQSAHCVVTTRLHAALPSLAFNTPVLAIKDKHYEKDRYGGLIDLLHSTSEAAYLKNPSIYSLDKPLKNKKDYLTLRKKLISTCGTFTGFSGEGQSFRKVDFQNLYHSPSFIWLFAKAIKSTHTSLLRSGDLKHLKKLTALQKQDISNLAKTLDITEKKLQKVTKELDFITNSLEWKLAAPLIATIRYSKQATKKIIGAKDTNVQRKNKGKINER